MSSEGAVKEKQLHPAVKSSVKDIVTDIENKLDNPVHGLAEIKSEIVDIEVKLDDPTYGLANIKAEVEAIENKLDDAHMGLASIKGEIEDIEAKLDDPFHGLAEIKSEIVDIEAKLDSPAHGLAEIKAEVAALEAKLDNATYGLSALNTDLDAIIAYVDSLETWLGNPSAHTLASITAKFGNNAQTLASILENFTATEAGFLGQRMAWLQQFIGKGTGTALAANKSLIDTLLLDPSLDKLIQTKSTCKAGCTVNLLQTNLTVATTDFYKDMIMIFTSGTYVGTTALIVGYNGTTKELTLDPAMIGAPAVNDGFVIFGVGVGKLASKSKGLDQIYNLVDTILVLTRVADTITTDGTEQNLYISDAPPRLIKPLRLMLDTTAHTATETVVLKVYYRLKSGGSYILFTTQTLTGVQSPLGVTLQLFPNGYGVKITIEKTAGTNRAYDYEVWSGD